ncbi:transaldolase [Gulosibacter molinativorax]|uniref:Transaldolase n=1 Tax=Gulosibacter molinativorax TaxID=256821 RepID=A0ABT7C7S3_9MICO|nr:transaldolase [Gulosibacter molinativorax]MDJ1371115.1 transaldolase [Gulosibacter molinativorax]QUY61475.1 Transaldolase [Gulosibacter molinativorax]
MTNNNTEALAQAGVSIWLDDLSRERLDSGSLSDLIAERNVVGVTTNPSIFSNALAAGHAYADQVKELAANGTGVDEAIIEITTEDVRRACDVLRPQYDATDGVDGRVSIEVSPLLANDTEGTIAEAKLLHEKVDRENVLIKIPATEAGLPAITEATASGISVNVTLIFSLPRYREVINAYYTGLEQALERGVDISKVHSVASFFVSRVDVEIDKRLDALGTDEATALKGKAGVANARLAYQVFEDAIGSERAKSLETAGARLQRPLWASTGVKDPSLPDTLYVVDLVAPNTVNTMPEKTLEAVADHGEIRGDVVSDSYHEANKLLDAIDDQGISYTEVTQLLEDEGVEKFVVAWNELKGTVSAQLEQAR